MKRIIKCYSDKSLINSHLLEMFEITYNNMLNIGVASKDDNNRDLWVNNQLNMLSDDNIKWILLFDDSKVIGYICYVINTNYVMLSEIQIDTKYHQDKESFPALFGAFLFDEFILSKDIICRANSKNIKAINLYKYMGFEFKEINANRIEFKCNSEALKYWYINKYKI